MWKSQEKYCIDTEWLTLDQDNRILLNLHHKIWNLSNQQVSRVLLFRRIRQFNQVNLQKLGQY